MCTCSIHYQSVCDILFPNKVQDIVKYFSNNSNSSNRFLCHTLAKKFALCVKLFFIIRVDRILIIKIIFIVSVSLTKPLCSYPISVLILQIALFSRTHIIYVRIPETEKERVFGKEREKERQKERGREKVWGKHSMLKNNFEWIKPVVLSEDHSSSNLVDWHYRFAENCRN